MPAAFAAIFIFQTMLTASRPALGAAAVLAILPAYLIRTRIADVPVTLLEAAVLGAILGWMIWNARRRLLVTKIRALGSHRLSAPAALFLAAATIAVVVSPDRMAALGIWKAYFIEAALFGILIADVMTANAGRRLALGGLAVSALAVILVALLQRFAGFPIPDPWQAELRVTGPYEFPNAVGLLLAPLAVLFIAAAAADRGMPAGARVALAAVGLLAILSAVLSKTEGGLIAAGIGLLLFGFLWSRRTRLAAVAVAAILAVIILSPGVFPVFRDKILLKDWSGIVRRTMWRETIAMLRDRPLFGAGLSGYPVIVAPYHRDPNIEIFQYPHNIVLNFWSETGLLGVITFAWLVVEFFRLAFRRGDPAFQIPLAAAMITLLVHGLVDVPYFKNDLSILFWAMIGLMSSATLPKTPQL